MNLSNELQELKVIKHDLHLLSNAFLIVGNTNMSEELRIKSDIINTITKNIQTAIDKLNN